MPTYVYKFTDTGETIEVHQAFTDDALTECPACGGALKKKFGSVGIAFKGTGFYKNDARGGSGRSSGGSGDSGGSSSGSESGSDAAASTSGASDSTSTATPAPS